MEFFYVGYIFEPSNNVKITQKTHTQTKPSRNWLSNYTKTKPHLCPTRLSLSKSSASIMEISSMTNTEHSLHLFFAARLRCTRPSSSCIGCRHKYVNAPNKKSNNRNTITWASQCAQQKEQITGIQDNERKPRIKKRKNM